MLISLCCAKTLSKATAALKTIQTVRQSFWEIFLCAVNVSATNPTLDRQDYKFSNKNPKIWISACLSSTMYENYHLS